MNLATATLKGRVIAVPETRELDVFAGLLERRGAKVVRCPLVEILDAPDPASVLNFVRIFSQREFDDFIILTGEGLRRILSCVERHEPALKAVFISALALTRKITRGPKPAKALRELGMQTDLAAEIATTDGVISLLDKESMRNRRVAVQLYGSDPNTKLIEWLTRSGVAKIATVAPYVYADAAEGAAVRSLSSQFMRREIDAIAFTSMQQVNRWFDVLGDETARAALQCTLVAAVGPVVEQSLLKRGVQVEVVPPDAFFLKPLTRALEERLGTK